MSWEEKLKQTELELRSRAEQAEEEAKASHSTFDLHLSPYGV